MNLRDNDSFQELMARTPEMTGRIDCSEEVEYPIYYNPSGSGFGKGPKRVLTIQIELRGHMFNTGPLRQEIIKAVGANSIYDNTHIYFQLAGHYLFPLQENQGYDLPFKAITTSAGSNMRQFILLDSGRKLLNRLGIKHYDLHENRGAYLIRLYREEDYIALKLAI